MTKQIRHIKTANGLTVKLSHYGTRIDAEMKVGALEETIQVTGAAPIVDVQSAVKVAVLDRDALDNIPDRKSTRLNSSHRT